MRETEFRIKFLQHIFRDTSNTGFTLAEVLITILLLGLLAAIALPNFLGQAGKGREAELKMTVGVINRSQQAFHMQNKEFATTMNDLGVTVPQQYQGLPIIGSLSPAEYTVQTNGFASNGTRAYSGLIQYDTAHNTYSSIICASDAPADLMAAPTSTNNCDTGFMIR